MMQCKILDIQANLHTVCVTLYEIFYLRFVCNVLSQCRSVKVKPFNTSVWFTLSGIFEH